jgi:hypothetical protein
MKAGILISSALFVIDALIMLVQLWFSLWEYELFLKIIITISAFFVISLVLTFVVKEIAETKRLKNSKDL